MSLTKEILGDLVNYDQVVAFHPLDPPVVDKGEISQYIHCPLFQRAKAKIDGAMERYTHRVQQAEERVRQSQEQIEGLEQTIEDWGKEAKGVGLVNRLTLDRSSASSVERYNQDVARHNEAVEQARRYQDRLEDAIDRHNDLVQRYNEAAAEAQERLDELNLQALGEIDNDLAAFLDRCSQVVGRLSDSEALVDQEAALETCFIGFKIYQTFGEHIDAPAARQQARQNLAELDRQFAVLCEAEQVHRALRELLVRNNTLLETNSGLYSQLEKEVGGVDQEQLDIQIRFLQAEFGENFRTEFSYQGLVNPSRLQGVMAEMQQSKQALNDNIQRVKDHSTEAQTISQAVAQTPQAAETFLAQMQSNVQELNAQLLDARHFLRDLISPAVIDGFYSREQRVGAKSLREKLVESPGEKIVNGLLNSDDDPYLLTRAEQTIREAGLDRLNACLSQVEPHVAELSRLVQDLQRGLERAQQVPAQNVDQFRSAAGTLYPLSCIPLLGVIPAVMVLKKVETFRPAFSSTIEVYRELGTMLLTRNQTFRKVSLFTNFPAALVLSQVDERLQSYLGQAAGEPVSGELASTE